MLSAVKEKKREPDLPWETEGSLRKNQWKLAMRKRKRCQEYMLNSLEVGKSLVASTKN